MRITTKTGRIIDAPKGFTRVVFTNKPKNTKRFVQTDSVETLELGVGEAGEMTLRKFRIFCRAIITTAKAYNIKKLAVQFDATPALLKCFENISLEEVVQLVAENFEMANYDFNHFKTVPKEGWSVVEEVLYYTLESFKLDGAITKGQTIGTAVNACRTLANTPGGDMTPSVLAKAAKTAVRGLPVTVKTLGVREMRKLGMGALLGVAKGSSEAPTFTIMEYHPSGSRQKPIVLAGKGVTFDSGGLNLKPTTGIYEMHMDMSGAASVIHAVALAARLKVKARVIGLIPAVENMPGNNAYRPGDILKSLSGKTVEVLNTDAEGRLILADALTYAKRFDPIAVIDIATLTGAAVSALGLHASALFTRDDALAKEIETYAEASGDYVWRLPLWDEYEENVQGTFADVTNSSNSPGGKYGGAIEGGMFLWQFAKELSCPWVHLDIAPRMTSAPGEELCKGAAGAPVRLLLRFIEQHAI